MPESRWTPDQERAIHERGRTLLVAAAAGSGKTSVLVQRVIERLLDKRDPVDVDELLVVTFTDAAAAEMRTRIAAALQDKIRTDPQDARTRRQLTLLGRASISTIHAFCKSVLRQHFHKLDLDPAFDVLGEHEALMIELDALDEVFEACYAREDDPLERFLALVDRYGGSQGDGALRRTVQGLYKQSRSLPWPDEWLAEAAAAFLPERGLNLWLTPQLTAERETAAGAARRLDRALDLAQSGGPGTWCDLLRTERDRLLAVAEAPDLAEFRLALAGIDFLRLPKGEADPDHKVRIKTLRDKAKVMARTLSESWIATSEAQAIAQEQMAGLAPLMADLADLVREFGSTFAAAKRDRAAVDFSDLEQLCLEAVAERLPDGTTVASAIGRSQQERYREIMVDEFQDTNPVQEAILTLVARPDPAGGEPTNLFMVGDVKQSIYRFRMADPELFLRRYERYPTSGDGPNRIDLQANFRSSRTVVEAINGLFRVIMTKEAAELVYDRAAELVCGVPGPNPVLPEFHLIGGDDDAADQQGENAAEDQPAVSSGQATTAEREATLVARRINELIAHGTRVHDKAAGGDRPLRYGDVAILMRAIGAQGPAFLEQLRQAGIPVHVQAQSGYFGALEIRTILALLEVVDNPRQDIPLAAVLRSPIVGLEALDLARIRLHREGEFNDAVRSAADQPADDFPEAAHSKLTAFLAKLENWRTAARREPLSGVIWRLLRETGFLGHVGGLPGGDQRRANLLAFHDRSREFDRFAKQGLYRFLRFIRRLEVAGEDLGSAQLVAENADVVRVMSIHKSKGLEFPLVFAVGLGRKFNERDLHGDVLFHRDLGLGPRITDPDFKIKYPSPAHRVVQQAIRRQNLAEEMRVLYVALTRARERLILVGSIKEGAIERWAEDTPPGHPIPTDVLLSARSYLDWIGPAMPPSGWIRHLHRSADLEAPPTDGTVSPTDLWRRFCALEPLEDRIAGPIVEKIAATLAWTYPHAAGARLLAKRAVTALAVAPGDGGLERPGEQDDAPDNAYLRAAIRHRPRFIQEGPGRLTPTERGTATHVFLQHLDFRTDTDPAALEARLGNLVACEVLTPEAAAAVDREAVLAFALAPLGRLLAEKAADHLREVPFSLLVPSRDIYPGEMGDDEVLVQGMIDALVLYSDGLLLIDYKTDRPRNRALADMAADHRVQMAWYRRAAEAMFERPVTQAFLVFLATGDVVLTN